MKSQQNHVLLPVKKLLNTNDEANFSEEVSLLEYLHLILI